MSYKPRPGSLRLNHEQQKLFDSHLWLIFRVIRRFGYRCPDSDLPDLLQHCRMSLAYIAAHWEAPQGISFGGRAWRHMSWTAGAFLFGSSRYFSAPLRHAAEREVSLDEVLTTDKDEEFTRLDLAEVKQAQRDYSRSCAERLEEYTLSLVNQTIEALDPDVRRVIQLRFQESLTHVEVSKKIGLSTAKVNRLEREGIQYLRQHLADKGLKTLPPDAPIPDSWGRQRPSSTPKPSRQ